MALVQEIRSNGDSWYGSSVNTRGPTVINASPTTAEDVNSFTDKLWATVRLVGTVLLIALAAYTVYKLVKPLVAMIKASGTALGGVAEGSTIAAEGIASASKTIGQRIADSVTTFAENPLKWIVQQIVRVVHDVKETVQMFSAPAAAQAVGEATAAVVETTVTTTTLGEGIAAGAGAAGAASGGAGVVAVPLVETFTIF